MPYSFTSYEKMYVDYQLISIMFSHYILNIRKYKCMHITYYIFYTHWHIDRQMAVQLVEISWGVSSRKGKCCLLLNIRRNWQPSHSFSY